MSNTRDVLQAMTNGFRQITAGIVSFAESAAVAARSLNRLQRAIILYIRARYVEAGKPYGNGYAPMMRWWRQQFPE